MTAASIVCTAGATFGGGYGSTGASISTAGVGEFNDALTTDGALTADNIVCTNAATFGGGYGATGATISTAGVIQANGAITSTTITLEDATTPSIALATGKTNTGTITINGKTSGSLIITTADATAEAFTFAVAAQTVGASSATIPDLVNSADTVVLKDLSQILTTKTIDGDDNTISDLAFTSPKEMAYASNIGKGIPFIISAEFDGPGTFTYTVDNGTEDLQVIKAWGYKKTASGANAADQIDIKNSGTTNNIFVTEELDGITDGTYFEFDGLDDAEDVVADGNVLQIVAAENAANGCDSLVHVMCMWV